MAIRKDKVVCVALLPSGRAIRFVRCDTRRMFEVNLTVQREMEDVDLKSRDGAARFVRARQMEEVALCLRGVTAEAVPVVMRKIGDGSDAKEVLDEAAMLKAVLKDEDAKASKCPWRSYAYQDLITDGDSHMFEALAEPSMSATAACQSALSWLAAWAEFRLLPRNYSRLAGRGCDKRHNLRYFGTSLNTEVETLPNKKKTEPRIYADGRGSALGFSDLR